VRRKASAPRQQMRRASGAVCGALRPERGRADLHYPLVCTADMVGCVFRRSAPLASLGVSGLFFALAWWSQTSDAFRAARIFPFVMASVSEAIQFRGAALDCFVADAPRNDEATTNGNHHE